MYLVQDMSSWRITAPCLKRLRKRSSPRLCSGQSKQTTMVQQIRRLDFFYVVLRLSAVFSLKLRLYQQLECQTWKARMSASNVSSNRSAPEAVSASGLRGQPAPSPHHGVSVWTTRQHVFNKNLTWDSQASILSLACPVCPAGQGQHSRESVCDGGVRPGLASGPLQYAQCGLGLGGRQERGRAWTENCCCWSTEAGLTSSQRLSQSCRVSTIIRQHTAISIKCV